MSRVYQEREDGKYDVFEDDIHIGVGEKDEDGYMFITLNHHDFTYADCYEKAKNDARRVVKETAMKITEKPKNMNPDAIAFVDTKKRGKAVRFVLAGAILSIIGCIIDIGSSVMFRGEGEESAKNIRDCYDQCWDAVHKK